ncbi:hypothetical protein GCM10027592_25830 [Spirosoma flavus]
MGLVMKVTPANIIRLWFGADTPIRDYQIKMNPRLWAACMRVNMHFIAPSGASTYAQYRKSDKVAFARLVQEKLQEHGVYEEAVL